MQHYRVLALYVAAVAILFLTYYFLPISREALMQWVSLVEARAQADLVGTSIIFFLASAILAYFAFPSMPLIYVTAGYCLDSLLGGIIVLLGSAVGGLAAFLFYRKHIPHRLRLPPKHSPLRLWLTLLGLRLSPIVPAPLVNFFAAFFSVSTTQYMTTSLLGSAPLIFFYETMGQQGHNYLYGEEIHWWQFSGYLAILAFSTLLSSLGPWRTFLKAMKQLKSEVFISIRQSAGAKWSNPAAAEPISE